MYRGSPATRRAEGEYDTRDRDVEGHGATDGVEQNGWFRQPNDHHQSEHRDREQVGLDREEAEEVPWVERRQPLSQARELVRDRDDRGNC